ncbi:hypothetical protein M621_12515 [Serratia plymuthica S13]|uniref:Uncharacterized protein n=1 Tax=Serratia plymuthica S13 TaxID=1348660 RepID=S4YRK3_SERPL|nr:hypothetical protein M621_12515 [Serratia plymuthica S13]
MKRHRLNGMLRYGQCDRQTVQLPWPMMKVLQRMTYLQYARLRVKPQFTDQL